MKAISLFSGVGGFEIGMERAGIETVLQCEIDPVALSVLRRHWPNVPKVEDVRNLCKDNTPALIGRGTDMGGERHSPNTQQLRERIVEGSGVDLVYGGFPCQDLSVAGTRSGLGGARSGLWFEFRRIVSELRPRWVVVENVPGLLSSNERRDFATIVEGLTGLGYGVAWRKLDAQFLLVPQRRGRVFFVATPDTGDGAGAGRAATVLSLCEGCGRNSQKGRKARQDVAVSLRSRSASGGVNLPGRGGGDDVNIVAMPLRAGRQYADMGDGSANIIPFGIGDVGYALRAEPSHSGDKGDGGINTTLVASPLAGHHRRDDLDNDSYVIAETLRGHPRPGSNAVGALTVGAYWDGGQVSDTLDVSMLTKGQMMPDKRRMPVVIAHGVRRLTPLECERLMGWPENWTRWRDDGTEIPDTRRYRLIGNGVVSTIAEFIARRLVAVDAIENAPAEAKARGWA